MTARPQSVFLERRTYRRRRLADAARLLPILGALLFLVPLLWPAGPGGPVATARGFVFVFAVWAGLIVVSAVLSRYLSQPVIDPQGEAPPPRPTG